MQPSDLFNSPDPREAQAREAWNIAVALLKNSGMHESNARRLFGKLLSANRLHASELLRAVRAAQSLSRARQDPAMACSWS